MRIITFLLLAIAMIIMSGCNTAGGQQTLSGLEGRWAFTILIQDNPEKWTGTWDISSNQILRDSQSLTWDYTGSILTVHDNQFETLPDAVCGDRHITKLSEMSVRVSSGDQYANITGSMDLTEISDLCDPVSKTPYLFGNVLRIPEENVNLANLAGTWDVELNMSGKLDGPLGIKIPIPIDEQINTTWVLNETGIQDAGELMSFSYNGSSLVIQFSGVTELTDSICGQGTVFYPGQLTAAIVAGSTSAQINGLINMNYISDNCGKQSGTITVTGTMTKRP